MENIFQIIWYGVQWIFGFLFFSFWGWLILLTVVLPRLAFRIRSFSRKRSFFRGRKAELSNPKNAQVRFLLGRLHYDAKQYRRALRYFRDALAVSLHYKIEVDPLLALLLGHTLLKLRRPTEAIEAYELSLELTPTGNQGEAECGLGSAHARLSHPDEAEAWWKKACTQNMSAIEPRLKLLALMQRRGKMQEARALQEELRSIELPPFLAKKQRKWRFLRAIYPLSRPCL